ncbi:phage holin [Planococcus sp. ANT_H30]|uniref:phage holin n=1 Tax=Planococcus sp. ANT_H30 TaxID=2597347 RepID=UPI0011EF7CE2|nr:phage holin [Planococcus sp. ANT_H30]KAA0956621.1 phage holin [Planococcus sp. ANT_H30]
MTNLPTDNGSIIRTVILGIALLNQLLVGAGYSPLPFEDAQIELMLSTTFTVVAAIVAWWKNNNLTRKAKMADKLAREKGLK